MYGPFPVAWTPDHTRAILGDGYSAGDVVLYERDRVGERRMIWWHPARGARRGEEHPLLRLPVGQFTASGRGLLVVDEPLRRRLRPRLHRPRRPGEVEPVSARRRRRTRARASSRASTGLDGDRFVARSTSTAPRREAEFDEDARSSPSSACSSAQGELEGGVVHGLFHDRESGRYALSFCTATSRRRSTSSRPERRRGGRASGRSASPPTTLSAGEDASFVSHDGLRVSARLYLPSPRLGYDGPRPLVYYVHGGPQGQERPNFAWFSMPLIQALTLEGFAVFVPNARGSTGYGQDYMKRVDRDWGGQDRLDHVYAMTEVLPQDERVDTSRAGVVGRSYGGYMTLTLAGRHPELWSAAVDMFGPYDLFTFLERVPPTWKPYFELALGNRSATATSSWSARRARTRATSRARCSSSRAATTRVWSSRSHTTSSSTSARRARTWTTSSSRTRATTSSSCRTRSAATRRSCSSSAHLAP